METWICDHCGTPREDLHYWGASACGYRGICEDCMRDHTLDPKGQLVPKPDAKENT